MGEKTAKVELACEGCRKRKRKCNGARPACMACVARSQECQYLDEDVSRKRKLNVDYVASLEETIEVLRGQILELSNRSDGDDRYQFRQEQELFGEEHPAVTTSGQPDQEKRLASAVDEVSAMIWKIDLGADGRPQFTGPSGNFTFQSASTMAEQVPTPATDQRPTICDSDVLVAKQEFATHFINHVNLYHQFIETSQMIELDSGSQKSSDAELLQDAIHVAGSHFSERQDAERIGKFIMDEFEAKVLQTCRSQPSSLVVQALCIIAWYCLACSHDNMAWMYLHMASAINLQLGLHVTALQNLHNQAGVMSPTDARLLRILWSFTLQDRIFTVMLGRQCSLPWRRIKARDFSDTLQPDANLEEITFGHQCRLWYLLDQYLDQIYDFDFGGLDFKRRSKLLIDGRERLFDFHHSVDRRLREDGKQKPKCVIVFQMSYQTALLLMHRPYLCEKPDTWIYRVALRSITAAASSITRLVHIYRKTDDLANAPPFLVHHIMSAAIMLLLNTTSIDQEICRRSMGRFRLCVSALEDMQRRWKRAADAILLLRELAHRWSVVHVLPIHLSAPLVPPHGTANQPAVHVEKMLGNQSSNPTEMDHEFSAEPDPLAFDFGEVYMTAGSGSPEPWGFANDYALQDLTAYPDFSQMFNHMWPENVWD